VICVIPGDPVGLKCSTFSAVPEKIILELRIIGRDTETMREGTPSWVSAHSGADIATATASSRTNRISSLNAEASTLTGAASV
jgi:hypothetical protein